MRRECRELFSPPPRVSDPDMHHGTCVTHVPWYRDRLPAVSFEVGGAESVPGIPGACARRNITYLVRGSWRRSCYCHDYNHFEYSLLQTIAIISQLRCKTGNFHKEKTCYILLGMTRDITWNEKTSRVVKCAIFNAQAVYFEISNTDLLIKTQLFVFIRKKDVTTSKGRSYHQSSSKTLFYVNPYIQKGKQAISLCSWCSFRK